jgi:hypothetical protein
MLLHCRFDNEVPETGLSPLAEMNCGTEPLCQILRRLISLGGLSS